MTERARCCTRAGRQGPSSRQDTMEVAGLIAKIINEEEPAKVFIDVGGLGAGVVD